MQKGPQEKKKLQFRPAKCKKVPRSKTSCDRVQELILQDSDEAAEHSHRSVTGEPAPRYDAAGEKLAWPG
jgi:hypothetical protein